ncbi:hypothetical protein R3P38DRAFT_277193 [Favolaschia claudopus]|uniref:Uncharacterized protein n=1 Tax=Favolaschia claudopus TaxID=2862362 RepID=A0AAV9ZQG2_9AGAR
MTRSGIYASQMGATSTLTSACTVGSGRATTSLPATRTASSLTLPLHSLPLLLSELFAGGCGEVLLGNTSKNAGGKNGRRFAFSARRGADSLTKDTEGNDGGGKNKTLEPGTPSISTPSATSHRFRHRLRQTTYPNDRAQGSEALHLLILRSRRHPHRPAPPPLLRLPIPRLLHTNHTTSTPPPLTPSPPPLKTRRTRTPIVTPSRRSPRDDGLRVCYRCRVSWGRRVVSRPARAQTRSRSR